MIYEIFVLVDDNIDEAKIIYNKVLSFFSSIMVKNFLGSKKLAYKINKKTHGCYFLIIGECENLFEKMKYEKKTNLLIWRYLILNLKKEFKSDDKIQKYIKGNLVTKFEYRKRETYFSKKYKKDFQKGIDK